MVKQIDVLTLKSHMQAGKPVYLLDVRNPWEYETARLADSLLIPLPELPSRLDEVTPEANVPIVVYCHHGIRSLSGASILEQAGHADVFSLSGGIDAWSRLVDASVPVY